MSRFRLAFLCLAALPASGGVAQIHADPHPSMVAEPPIVTAPPRPPRMRAYPVFHDDLIRIYFDRGSTYLTPTAERIVDLSVEWAQRCGYQRITIAGHTDAASGRAQAIAHSRRMAEAVRGAMIARGADPSRIAVEGYGFSRPAIATAPGAREPFNRRIEMAISCSGDTPGRKAS